MEKLVDEAARKRFNGGKLLGRQRAQARMQPLNLRLANLFGLPLQSDDHRRRIDRALALVEALDFARR